MRILWICNIMLPVVAQKLGLEASNKEGWLTGLLEVIMERQEENRVVLGVAFPVESSMDGCQGEILVKGQKLSYYGFYEDVSHAERYDKLLEQKLLEIAQNFQPDVIHCFGTEYGHTLAICRAWPHKEQLLVGIQGLCAVYANTYQANLPEQVWRSTTFRDWLKKDSLRKQQEKFRERGRMEIEAIKNAGNVTGRTKWDRHYTEEWHPGVRYFALNETLRSSFYVGKWDKTKCEPHRIFLSQGDYPIKGLHYMLLALLEVRKHYPDVKVCVAGNSLVKDKTLKDKIKLSAYGKYLRTIIHRYHMEDHIQFLGKLDTQEMKQQYLQCGLFVCCSTIENSPNSLGEAMLLGTPCVSADVGGIPSLFVDKEDGILYQGFRTDKNSFDQTSLRAASEEVQLKHIVRNLETAVLEMWDHPEKLECYSQTARTHAQKTHNREHNYHKMMEIYAQIAKVSYVFRKDAVGAGMDHE